MWLYNDIEFTENNIEGYFGFVYLIENKINGRKYVGKKFFTRAGTRQIKGKKICIVGLSYKPDVPDLRDSPSLSLWDQLEQVGAFVFYHDNFHKTFRNKKNENLNDSYFDLSIIAVQHKNLDMDELKRASKLLVNAIGEKLA